MRAISTVRTSRTVIDATTSSRLSLSLTLLCRMSRIGTAGPPSCLGLGYAPALCCPASTLAASKHGLSMNYTTDFKSIRAEVSAEEWQARVDLAACYRRAARTELVMPGENVLAHTAHLYQPGTRRPYGVLEWPAMLRLLEAEDRHSGYPPYWL